MTATPPAPTPSTAYPAPPWSLEGSAIVSPWLVSARVARRLVPAPLQVIELVPGLTLGAIFAASYVDSPVGSYDELGFAPALVSSSGGWGFFISHLYVDTRASVEAGRAHWGLPKEYANIDWRQPDGRVEIEVRVGRQVVCLFESRQRGAALPATVRAPFVTRPEHGVLRSSLSLRARFAPASSRLHLAAGSPLEGLGLRLGLPSLWAWESEFGVAKGQ